MAQVTASDETVDPFAWTKDDLLLAESFARLYLEDEEAAIRWYREHGAVLRADFMTGYAELPQEDEHEPGVVIGEWLMEAQKEQTNVRWHLETILRLSQHRDDHAWEPGWSEVVLVGPEGEVIIGGPHAGTQRTPRSLVESMAPYVAKDEDRRRDLDTAQALLDATASHVEIDVTPRGWFGFWRPAMTERTGEVPDEAKTLAGSIESSWRGTLELERLLIAPYVGRAVERRFSLEMEDEEVGGVSRSVLVPREERQWRSVLAPIYLQIFEALRRITEGEPGAARCRECGRPFLVIDARRKFFCNDRERYRHAQRERRARLRAEEQ
jgi:hypothetical protein